MHDRLLAWRKEIKAPLPTANKGESPPPEAKKKAKGKKKATKD
jgi:hypothetical protein